MAGPMVNALGQLIWPSTDPNAAQNPQGQPPQGQQQPPASGQHPIFNALYKRYMSSRRPPEAPAPPTAPDGATGMMSEADGMNAEAAGEGMGDAAAGVGAEAGGDIGDALGGLGGLAAMAQGAVVTKPTIARIGEKGPEAVIPLTPRPGNKMQPDLMEGHLAPPHVPGVRFSRYRGYNRFGPSGGQV